MPFIEVNGHRPLFVHIPRTGGTSVEKWMSTIADVQFRTVGTLPSTTVTAQHFQYSEIEALFRPGFFDFAFTVVRNPFRRLESEFRLRSKLGVESGWREAPNFHLWLESNLRLARQNENHLDNHLRPQWHFISDKLEVYRFEHGVDIVIKKLCEFLGTPIPEKVPHALQTNDMKINFDWDIRERTLVLEHFAKDFDLLGYPTDPHETDESALFG